MATHRKDIHPIVCGGGCYVRQRRLKRCSEVATVEVIQDISRHDDVRDVATPLDDYHDVQRLVIDALNRSDALHMDAGRESTMDDNDEFDNDIVDGLRHLYAEVTTALYP